MWRSRYDDICPWLTSTVVRLDAASIASTTAQPRAKVSDAVSPAAKRRDASSRERRTASSLRASSSKLGTAKRRSAMPGSTSMTRRAGGRKRLDSLLGATHVTGDDAVDVEVSLL